ncbi:MAG: homogentisate 1,2-dioxygenase, partial [Planctomycetales bacterium]
DGNLYAEHLMGTLGFSGPASLLYHLRSPTRVLSTSTLAEVCVNPEPDRTLRMRHFHCGQLPAVKSASLDRTPILFNADVIVSMVRPTETDDFFFRNGQADQIVYISEGDGILESEFGKLAYRPGDYVIVPRGILHRFRLGKSSTLMLVFETPSYVCFPSRYLTQEGQLMEHAPYCERDIRTPTELEIHGEQGEFRIVVKQNDVLTEVVVDHHPLNVVGWDGCYYPWAMSIHDFEPITGSLHQPPPVHQTFQADQFVLCSFTPRLFDFHPDAIPVPYNHSNVMSDEVIFYANNEFMSRKDISYGSLTLHPAGLPHGPHPGRVEASIGKQRTDELAVMIDTFRPLNVAADVLEVEDPQYARSWLEE